MKKILFTLFVCLNLISNAQRRVKVMSYNIRYENAGDGINQWKNRKDSLIFLINKYDPDVIGMQEVLNHQLMDLKAGLPGYEGFGVGRDDGKEQGEYAAVFFKKNIFERTDGNYFWLSETPEIAGSKSWDAAITRMVSWCKLKHQKTGKIIYIFNTHFDHVGKVARRNSALLIKEKIKSIAGNELFILTGDLNTEPNEEPYQILDNPANKPLFIDVAQNNTDGTFCGFNVSNTSCKRIDYIFCSKKMKAKSYSVVHDNNGVFYPSDHMPVIAEIAF